MEKRITHVTFHWTDGDTLVEIKPHAHWPTVVQRGAQANGCEARNLFAQGVALHAIRTHRGVMDVGTSTPFSDAHIDLLT